MLLFGIGAALLLLGGWLWARYVYVQPERVFWGMIENNLSSYGVTKRTAESNQLGSTEQYAELGFGDTTLAHSVTYVRQATEEGDSRVVTESIATKDAAYNRYTSVDTPIAGSSGQPLDFSNVIGVWGKTEPEDEAGGSQYLAEYLLGVVPYGNLPAEQRQELIRFMREHDVFVPDYAQVEKTAANGRAIYNFPVAIKPAAYIGMLQTYARLSGIGEVPGLNASDYENSPDLLIQFSIEPYSRNLRSLTYETAGGREEEYFSHGVRPGVRVPEETIPISELQERLQAIQ